MKIIYAGTLEISISSLETINNSSHEISLVLTMPDKISGRGKKIKEGPIKKFSKAHSLKVFQPENLKNLKDQEKISSLNPDLIVVFAYGKILPKEILSIPRLGCLNVHTSLLPKYRGAAPIQRAIFNDERKTGLSFIKMDEGLDTGSIYKSFEIEIEEEETSDTLSKKLSNLTSSLILEVIDNINRLVSVTADHSEFRNIVKVDIISSQKSSCKILLDSKHSMEERVLKEQFYS